MCFLSERGHFILARNGTILASRRKRDAAKRRLCGNRGSVCVYCGVARGILPEKLYLQLLDPEFVLLEPIKLNLRLCSSTDLQESTEYFPE